MAKAAEAKAEKAVEIAKKDDAAAHEAEVNLEEQMDKKLEEEERASIEESQVRQEVFAAAHEDAAKEAAKEAHKLDEVLGEQEKAPEESMESIEKEEEQAEKDQVMLHHLQGACAERVMGTLEHLYDAAASAQSGKHLSRKARFSHQLALDKAIRAAKQAKSPKIGHDLGNDISKAIQAARETWIAAAGVRMFDASLAPLQARAEHLLLVAESQYRQCQLLSIEDVIELRKHKAALEGLMGSEDGEEEGEGSGSGSGAEGKKKSAKKGKGGKHALPKDPCLWSMTPEMTVEDIAHHITACRRSREDFRAWFGYPWVQQWQGEDPYTASVDNFFMKRDHWQPHHGHHWGPHGHAWGPHGHAWGPHHGHHGHHWGAHHRASFGGYGSIETDPYAEMAGSWMQPNGYSVYDGQDYGMGAPALSYGAYAGYGPYGSDPSFAAYPYYQGFYGAADFGMWPPVPQPGPTHQDAMQLAETAGIEAEVPKEAEAAAKASE